MKLFWSNYEGEVTNKIKSPNLHEKDEFRDFDY